MASAFSVVAVNERATLGLAGNLENVTVLHVKTMRGATGTVEVPTDQYLALTSTEEGKAVLREMLQEKANSLEAPFEM